MTHQIQDAAPTVPVTYSVAEVAEMLGVSEGTVRQLTHLGQLHRLPINRPWRYAAREIEHFLNSRQPVPARDEPSDGRLVRLVAGEERG